MSVFRRLTQCLALKFCVVRGLEEICNFCFVLFICLFSAKYKTT
jgi:hypothetical protein